METTQGQSGSGPEDGPALGPGPQQKMEPDFTGTEPTPWESGPGSKGGPAVGPGPLEQQSRRPKVDHPEETDRDGGVGSGSIRL